MTRTDGSKDDGPKTGLRRRRARPAAPARGPAAWAEALEDRVLFADTVAPAATFIRLSATNPAGQNYLYNVRYTDDVAVNQNTIDDFDTIVTGPSGSMFGTVVSNTPNGNGSFTAQYSVPAPPMAGTYQIALRADQVADTSGNPVPGSPLGQFQQLDTGQGGLPGSTDKVSPTATLLGTPAADPAGTGYNLNVSYTDDVDLSTPSISNGDLIVTGPGGYSNLVTLQSITNSTLGIRTVRYRIPNPVIRGTYTISVQPGEVSDTSMNFVQPGIIGTFTAGFASSGGGGVTAGGGANFFNPDVAAAVTKVPEKAATLGRGRVTVRLANLGDHTTPGRVDVSLFVSPNRVLGSADTMILRKRTVRLKGGQTRSFTFRVRFPDLPAGDYFIAAQADQSNALREPNETNNIGFSTNTVAISVPSVDLSPKFVGTLPAEVVGGDPGRVTVQVTNNGTATYNTDANITIYASTDGVLDTTVDPVVKPASGVPLRISPGHSKNVPIDFNYPTNLPDGSYSFIAVVAAGNAVDTNPNNNTAVTPSQVLVRTGFIDLRADSISVTSGPLVVGGTNTVEVTVTNTGNVTASGTLGIALTATSPTLAGEVPLTRFAQSVTIGSLASQTFRIDFALPSSLPSGSYFFKAALDPDNVFVERDETNNSVTTLNPFPTP